MKDKPTERMEMVARWRKAGIRCCLHRERVTMRHAKSVPRCDRGKNHRRK